MKVIIAGGRDFDDYPKLCATMFRIPTSEMEVTEIVCGKAPGADTLGERYAKAMKIPVKEFPAEWDIHGKSAGPIRNSQMAEYADALVAFWDGKSHGTKDMIEKMAKLGKKILVISYKNKPSILSKVQPVGLRAQHGGRRNP